MVCFEKILQRVLQASRHQGGQGGHGPPTFLLGNYFLSYEYFHFNLRNTKIETKGEKYINATIVSKAHSLSLSFYNVVIHNMMFQNHSAR